MCKKSNGLLVAAVAAIVFSSAAEARGGEEWGYYGSGFAAVAVIGALLAAPFYHGAPYHQPEPGYYYGPPPGDAVDYCMQRFKSYNRSSGTYLGNDGYRHPCP